MTLSNLLFSLTCSLLSAMLFFPSCTGTTTPQELCVVDTSVYCRVQFTYDDRYAEPELVPPPVSGSLSDSSHDDLSNEASTYTLYLGGSFWGESVRVFLNSTVVFQGNVTTDGRTGLVHVVTRFKRNGDYRIEDYRDKNDSIKADIAGSATGGASVDSISVCVDGCLITGSVTSEYRVFSIDWMSIDKQLEMQYRHKRPPIVEATIRQKNVTAVSYLPSER